MNATTARAALLIALTSFGLATACKVRQSSALNEGDSGPAFLTELASEADYSKLVAVMDDVSFVKYTFELATPEQTVYFQNTAKHDFHFDFLTQELPEKYGQMTRPVLEELMFNPPPKEFSLGAVYYAPNLQVPGFDSPGVLAFTVYPVVSAGTDVDEVERVFLRMKQVAPFAGTKIVYAFDNTQDFFAKKAKLQLRGISSIRVSQLLGQTNVTKVYNAAKSYGFVRKLTHEEFQAGDYTSKDILVLENVPLDIGPISGIITGEPQVPHSHVILRTINQKVPNVFVPGAASQAFINKYVGQLVEMETTAAGQVTLVGKDVIGEAELLQRADNYFATRVPQLPELNADLSVTAPFSWQGAAAGTILPSRYGAKGTNFAILDNALRAGNVDRALFEGSFLIPFSRYRDHTAQALTPDLCKKAKKECGEDYVAAHCEAPATACTTMSEAPGATLSKFFAAMVEPTHASKMVAEGKYRKGYLAFAQALITKAKLDKPFLKAVTDKLATKYDAKVRIRFRSSTNAEDLPGLNGAGLYTSKAGCPGDGDGEGAGASVCQTSQERARDLALIAKLEAKDPVLYADMIADLKDDLDKKRPLDKAIKKVFASLWNEKAFLSRDYYRIDHLKVFMGVLVHPSFVDEGANGVAVVRPAEGNVGDLEINAVVQVDDISITNPEIDGAVPDQLAVTRRADGSFSEIKYLLRNNQVPNGASILTDAQVQDLATQLSVTYQALKTENPGGFTSIMDAEFKRNGTGGMVMKQARPL